MKHFLIVILLLFLFLVVADSCKKSEPYSPPVVEILSPIENQLLQVPGFMEVQVSVASEKLIKYIRISVDNDELTPLFAPKFFYPDSNITFINYDLPLDQLPAGQKAPFYFHVAVEDGVEMNHEYREVRLSNATLFYKGFYLFSQPTVNRTQIDYVDPQYQVKSFANVNGDYIDSDVSDNRDMVFLATSKPGELTAYEFESQQLKWQKEAANPYPDYLDILHVGNRLYAATGNGQITSFADDAGIVKVITPVLFDSVPNKIGVGEDYFIGDFWVRNQPSRSWVVFYVVTGQKFQTYPTDVQVVDFYPIQKTSEFSVIGNKSGKGVFLKYHVSGNYTSDSYIFSNGLISNSCLTGENEFLVSVGNNIFLFDAEKEFEDLVYEFQYEVVDIKYDPVHHRLFVAFNDRVEIFSWPSMQKLKTIVSEHQVKGLNIRYSY